MAATRCASGNIIKIINPPDVEWVICAGLNNRNISCTIMNFRESEQPAIIYRGAAGRLAETG